MLMIWANRLQEQ